MPPTVTLPLPLSPSFRELQWLRLKQKHVFDVGVTIFKVLRGFYPDWFLSLNSRQDNYHQ